MDLRPAITDWWLRANRAAIVAFFAGLLIGLLA